MKKVLITAVATLTTTLIFSTSYAGGKKNGHSKHQKNDDVPGISYSIDPVDCGVTISSSEKIKSISIKDAEGNTLHKWRKVSDTSFSDFELFTSLLTDGSLIVKLATKSKRRHNKRNGKHGSRIEIGDAFRAELQACLDIPVVACPTEVTEGIDAVLGSRIPEFFYVTGYSADSCELYGEQFYSIGLYNGESTNNGSAVGASLTLPNDSSTDSINVQIPLTREEVGLCATYANCLFFNPNP